MKNGDVKNKESPYIIDLESNNLYGERMLEKNCR